MDPIILFRDGNDYPGEFETAQEHFQCIPNRAKIPSGKLVICRYSAWPYYKELETDINDLGGKLINSFIQHRYIADLGNYVHHLEGITPKTWNQLDQVPDDEGPFVLKGETNSKKFEWDTMMYAETKQDAIRIYLDLQNDGLIGYQNIYIRKYVPMIKYLTGFRNMPVTKEFRFFICYGKVISGGYYWSNYIDDLPEKPDVNEVPKEFLNEVIERVGKNCNFYVVDVGQKLDGSWMVVELNDGSQSGLSDNEPETLYKNLAMITHPK
jgi:hypothetical protein